MPVLAQPGTRREFNGFVKDQLPRRGPHAEVTMRTSISDQLEPDVQAGHSDSLKLTHMNQILALCPSEAPSCTILGQPRKRRELSGVFLIPSSPMSSACDIPQALGSLKSRRMQEFHTETSGQLELRPGSRPPSP